MKYVIVGDDGWQSPPLTMLAAEAVKSALDRCYEGTHRLVPEYEDDSTDYLRDLYQKTGWGPGPMA